MSTHLSDTESLSLSTTTESLLQKSWHILALLLSLGRRGGPTTPARLASLCTLFHASPAAIEYLCSIPNSPISLTSDGLVAISYRGLLACGEFFANFKLFDAFVNVPLPRSLSFWIGKGDCLPNKRKRIVFDSRDGDEEEQIFVKSQKRMRKNYSAKVCYYMSDHIDRSVNLHPRNMSAILSPWVPPLRLTASAEQLTCELKNAEHVQDEMHMNVCVPTKVPEESMACEPDRKSSIQSRYLNHQMDLVHGEDSNPLCCPQDVKQGHVTSPVECANFDNDCKDTAVRVIESEEIINGSEGKRLIDLNMPPVSDFERINEMNYNDTCLYPKLNFPETEISVAEEQLPKPSTKASCRDVGAPGLPATTKSLRNTKINTTQEKQQFRRGQTMVSKRQKLKQTHNEKHSKENKRKSNSISSEDQPKPKALPNFEAYTVEEEEGSGGYGTVYRARRKIDGSKVAIKCPHPNAHRHHINNELRMLERFGGKNFVIKYEGSFKNGDSDCFVLEHVEHDRPEVLKKEIDICQLRWYGYCMFRALASLHKQGIFHRDVKPGNFLFSRKTNKGYLIDFNLALDLHQKYGTSAKSKLGYDVGFSRVTLPSPKPVSPMDVRKFTSAKSDAVNQGPAKVSKAAIEPKNLKRKALGQARAFDELRNWNKINSQGAEGSGITSAKEVTSTRTPSAERLREPLPCQGRKELINLLQKAIHSPNQQTLQVPAPMRKRVAAPPGKVDRGPLYLTPMPLHSTGIAVAGAGLMKSKGDGKQKREGPCAGTKGFRAPEVLFRSPHQGPKADVWSAGVTLLYLMTGRTPFTGDPEQNIKEIAKLKGSEDLWEVAKLHGRESSFPEDLYDTGSLPSINLREWCHMNGRRRDFLETIPSSLFDLVDKCLTANPRLRISAEDALKHEFLAPCYGALKKQRLLRQGHSLESAAGHSFHGQSSARTVKIS